MQLPCAWFDQIVGTLEAPPSPGPSAEACAGEPDEPGEPGVAQRRREPRLGVRARVTLIPLTDADGIAPAPLAVPLRDLSAGGIGFLHSEKVPLDAQFVALLPHGNDSVAVLCRVAYYQPLGDRIFAVGAKFVRVLRQPAGVEADSALTLAAPDDQPLRRAAS